METLTTKNAADFRAFVDTTRTFKGSLTGVSSPCLIDQAGRCPDQNLPEKNCGTCEYALQDEQTMSDTLQEAGFEVKHESKVYWYTNTGMNARFSAPSGKVLIEHSNARVNVEFTPR